MREIFNGNGLERKALAFFSSLLILAVLGPFGTYEVLTFWERVVFWTMALAGVGFFAHVLIGICLTTTHLGHLNKLLRLALGAATGAVPGAAFVVFVAMVFRIPGVSPETMPSIWFQASLITYAIGLVEFVNFGFLRPHEPEAITTRFHARLPADTRHDIISLSMQDHYVEVTTREGRHLILMRMSDAINELTGLKGLRLHRSHWIAAAHVAGQTKTGNRRYAFTSDGRKLPVSDRYTEDLALLLDDPASAPRGTRLLPGTKLTKTPGS